MAMIAYKCPEIQVVVVDINQVRIALAATTHSRSYPCCLHVWPQRAAGYKQPCLFTFHARLQVKAVV